MRPAFGLLAALLTVTAAGAQTSFPMITHTAPTAVQRGTTAEVTVEGQMNFAGAYKVLFSDPNIVAEVAKIAEPTADKGKGKKGMAAAPTVRSVTLKVTVAPDAVPGVREFRVATAQGISSLGQLLVTADPVVTEKPGINLPTKAQPVTVPSVITGRIESAENVDYYKVTAKAGQVLTLEVFCARIQDKIHDLQKHADPLVTVYDATGRELAAADDALFADPLLTFPVPVDGEYVIQVRDAKYDGDPRWVYALAVTDRPYAAITYPLAANPGKTVSVEPVGSAKLAGPNLIVTAPTTPGIQTVQIPVGNDGPINPTPLVVTSVPLVNEQEPNDDIPHATKLPIPGGANGRIQVRRDLDYYVFQGQKGKAIKLEIFARRFGTELRSRVDTVLDVMDMKGKSLASNDDANGKDAMLVFTPPADGEYVVRVRDLNNKGGEGYVYYLEADLARPDFTLKTDPSKALIGPGSRTAWYVQVTRTGGFEGPVKVEALGLPAGVSVNPLTISANMTVGCLVVSADKDAKMDASIVKIVGTAEAKEDGKPVTLTHPAVAVEEIYFPGGGRGRFDAGMLAASVTGPSDLLEVQVKPAKITLKPGQEIKIDVNVKRRADYDKGVTLDVILRHLGGIHANPLPPGVSMVDNKSKTLLGTGNAGHITLKAAPDAAECEDVPICVQAFVSVNFVVKIGYASEPILVSVKK